MNELIVVGISDFKISKTPNILATYALGSCVGTSLFDTNSNIGGLSHVMLPESKFFSTMDSFNRMKFADTAIVDLVEEMTKQGANIKNLRAKIAGGANMFESQSDNPFGNIGERNVKSIKDILKQLNIPIIGEDIGANYGRTVFFDTGTGKFTVKSIGRDIVEL